VRNHVNMRLVWMVALTLWAGRTVADEPATNVVTGAAVAVPNAPVTLSAPKDGDTIIIVGDSLTEHGNRPYGYVTLMRDVIAAQYRTSDITVRGSGVGYDSSQNVRKRLQEDVLRRAPTIVIVEIGLADLYYSERRPNDRKLFKFAMKDIVWQIRRAGALPVLMTLTTIGECTDGSNPEDALIEDYSVIIREVAGEKRCPLIDLRPAFMAFLERVNPDNLRAGVLTLDNDGVHLNPDGNQLMANLILEAFHVHTPTGWRDTLAERIRARLDASEGAGTP